MDINTLLLPIVEAVQNLWAALSMFGTWFIVKAWPHIWELFFIGILYKAIFAHWAADQIMKWGKRRLIKSKEQLALWFHFRDRAMKRGHLLDPGICLDGLCGEIKDASLKK